MKLTITINIGNDAMNSSNEISEALGRLADRFHTNGYVETVRARNEEITRGVMDVNGNSVGFWILSGDDIDKLDRAMTNLTDAQIIVSGKAREVSDTAFPDDTSDGDYYCVPKEDMDALREALKEWTKASEEYLKAIHEG